MFGSQPQPAWNLDGISKDSANAEDILGSQVNDQESTLEPAFGESSQTDKGEKKKHAIDAAAMVGKAQAEVARTPHLRVLLLPFTNFVFRCYR